MIFILKLESDSKTKRKKHTQPYDLYTLRVLVIMNCKFKTYVFLIVPFMQ